MSNEEDYAIVSVPVVVEPIAIAIPPRTVPVRVRHHPVAVVIAKERNDARSHPYAPVRTQKII